MKQLLPVCLVALFAATSCGKDSGSSTPTKTETISSASWKYDAAGIDGDRNGTIDIPPPTGTILPCMTDNTITFNANGTGTIDEGTTKCNTTDPQSTAINWSFTNSETALNLNGTSVLGVSGPFKILSLTSTQLSLAKDTTVAIIGAVSLVVNLKH